LELNAGTLDNGASADICIFHPHYSWRYEAQHIASAGKNTPFLGWNLRGFVTHTLLDGNIVHEVDEATFQQVITQGAYEAEQAPATTISAGVAVEPDETDRAEDNFVYQMEDDGFEEELLEELPSLSGREEKPEPPTRQSAPPNPKEKKTTEKKSGGAELEPELSSSGRAAETRGGAIPIADKSAAVESDAYRPAFSQFKVPHTKFAPLSDQVVKNKTDSAPATDKKQPISSTTQPGKEDD
jgi:hypothetical protein